MEYKIVCINKLPMCDGIEIGETYIATAKFKNYKGDLVYLLKSSGVGESYTYSASQFIELSELRDNKLKELGID